jgi:hypothetical protein
MSTFSDSYMSRVLFATPRAGPQPPRGCPTVALAQDLSVRLVPARAALHARPWPEMAREARARCQVLKVANVPHPGRL